MLILATRIGGPSMLINLTLAVLASLVLSAEAVRQPPTAPPVKLTTAKGESLSRKLERGA